ncbi:MAG: 4'-phosphopantetheinyl transferase superfamily protein [Deltaproteobacteria bacterium]|nr:4'-phosphopantetheinyl transferase superfamily protein [Deltaproteobacteria bacterium]
MNNSVLTRYNNVYKKAAWLSGEELVSMKKLPPAIQIKYFPQKIFQKYVLNLYTQVPPVNIRVNFQHKPQVEFLECSPEHQTSFSPVPIYYNLSHTEGFSVMALATREIGVDVEKVRPVNKKARLNPEIFSKEELKKLKQEPESSDISFWKLWTLKEAYLKWQGLNLQSNISILPQLNFVEKHQGVHILQNHNLNLLNSTGKINPETAFLLQKQINHAFVVSVCSSLDIFTIPNGLNCQQNFSKSEPGNFYRQTLKMEKIFPDKIEIFEFNNPHGCKSD